MSESKVHIYTGDGKGKTTCAFGLAMRAAGRGLKTAVVQFLKTQDTGEVIFLNKFCGGCENIKVYRFETEHGFTFSLTEDEKAKLKSEIKEAVSFVKTLLNKCDLIVLDEMVCLYNLKFVSYEDLDYIIKNRGKTEIVLTGRGADESICALADYVTQMQPQKHPYTEGIQARCGIEF